MLILHIIGTSVRGVVQKLPIIGFGDALLGGVIGFIEAWLLWLLLLILLGNFLASTQTAINQASQIIPGLNIGMEQFASWHNFYNEAITNSIFAQVNSFFIKQLPNLPQFPR
jgi:uncharacterized membrane protein required for colicin V production